MLHVKTSNMFDLVALDGQSTCDECLCDRNACKTFFTMHKHVWHLNCLYLKCDTCANVPISAPSSRSCTMTKLSINLYISNTTTELHGQKQSWEIILTRCDQLTDHMVPVIFYIAGTRARRPAVLYPRKSRNRSDYPLRTMFSQLIII